VEPHEWAKSHIEEMQTKRGAIALKQAVFLKRQELVEAHAPELWEAVIQAFQEHHAAYNRNLPEGERSLGFHCVDRNLHMLRRDGGWSELKVSFNPSTRAIRVKANNCSFDETYLPKVLNDGEMVLLCRRTRSTATPNEIAQTAMGAFLSGREIAELL
jgi:hypothetical protein